jgi:hypothetical protein
MLSSYLFILIVSLMNFSLFFLNEESLIFVSLILFFLVLYFWFRRAILAVFFAKIEFVYLIFCYLLSLLIKLWDRILKFVINYKLQSAFLWCIEPYFILIERLSKILKIDYTHLMFKKINLMSRLYNFEYRVEYAKKIDSLRLRIRGEVSNKLFMRYLLMEFKRLVRKFLYKHYFKK